MSVSSNSIDPNRQYLPHEEVKPFIESMFWNIEELQSFQDDEELENADDVVLTLQEIQNWAFGVIYDARDAIERILDMNGSREGVRRCVDDLMEENNAVTREALKKALGRVAASDQKLPKDVASGLKALGLPKRYDRRAVNTYGRAFIAFSRIKWSDGQS
ncbi:hypothetical protein [Oricola indica]|jgi:hypothetical protein|uniref:hypothetical protein n=1 Tax=Oricola indica TaxID=2872591 RepID=UPI001CBE4601|nr:hypothetical protein [Oricola indica]